MSRSAQVTRVLAPLLRSALGQAAVGATLVFQVGRQGQLRFVTVTLE